MTENPFARIAQRGFQSMIEAMEEELGQICRQFVQGLLTPDMLASLMGMMQQSLRGMGIDIGQVPGMIGQQPGLDPYKVLGLDKSASDEVVKQRYLELISRLHPDRAGSGFDFLAALVNAAYQAICQQRGIK